MRLALLASAALTPELDPGAAADVAALRDALARRGATLEQVAPRRRLGGERLTRWWFNRRVSLRDLEGFDAVLALNGDGYGFDDLPRVPFLCLLTRAAVAASELESGTAAQELRREGRWVDAVTARADLVIVPSEATLRGVAAHHAVPVKRFRVVPPAFDAVAWQHELPLSRRARGKVLTLGPLAQRRGIDTLLAAFPGVTAHRRDARLEIVGSGEPSDSLRSRVASLPAVRLYGVVPRVSEWYASADVFCLATADSAYSRAAVEAMASGLPVVVTDAGSLVEVTEGAERRVVPVGDPAALAAAVLDCLGDQPRDRAATTNPAVAARHAPEAVADLLLAAVDEARGLRRV